MLFTEIADEIHQRHPEYSIEDIGSVCKTVWKYVQREYIPCDMGINREGIIDLVTQELRQQKWNKNQKVRG